MINPDSPKPAESNTEKGITARNLKAAAVITGAIAAGGAIDHSMNSGDRPVPVHAEAFVYPDEPLSVDADTITTQASQQTGEQATDTPDAGAEAGAEESEPETSAKVPAFELHEAPVTHTVEEQPKEYSLSPAPLRHIDAQSIAEVKPHESVAEITEDDKVADEPTVAVGLPPVPPSVEEESVDARVDDSTLNTEVWEGVDDTDMEDILIEKAKDDGEVETPEEAVWQSALVEFNDETKPKAFLDGIIKNPIHRGGPDTKQFIDGPLVHINEQTKDAVIYWADPTSDTGFRWYPILSGSGSEGIVLYRGVNDTLDTAIEHTEGVINRSQVDPAVMTLSDSAGSRFGELVDGVGDAIPNTEVKIVDGKLVVELSEVPEKGGDPDEGSVPKKGGGSDQDESPAKG